ncbi:hypothetical protein BDV39DRAFT_183337 [Aspergillus sergii]|uniref:Secreted protein n=1 Tax=Aspergillus sergii TaxID=1034303 RepID=A0A5N6WS26_9EURO|nr:hypothetical protein BDV39DRAFT_183337 [Aspergillus sergii]
MSSNRFPTGVLLWGISNCWGVPTGGCDNSVPTDCKDCCGRSQTSKVQESRQKDRTFGLVNKMEAIFVSTCID